MYPAVLRRVCGSRCIRPSYAEFVVVSVSGRPTQDLWLSMYPAVLRRVYFTRCLRCSMHLQFSNVRGSLSFWVLRDHTSSYFLKCYFVFVTLSFRVTKSQTLLELITYIKLNLNFLCTVLSSYSYTSFQLYKLRFESTQFIFLVNYLLCIAERVWSILSSGFDFDNLINSIKTPPTASSP